MPKRPVPGTNREQLKDHWTGELKKALQGRTIVSADYLDDTECRNFGWDQKGIVLQLDDRSLVIVMQDPEGNGPGAIAVQKDNGTETLLGPLVVFTPAPIAVQKDDDKRRFGPL